MCVLLLIVGRGLSEVLGWAFVVYYLELVRHSNKYMSNVNGCLTILSNFLMRWRLTVPAVLGTSSGVFCRAGQRLGGCSVVVHTIFWCGVHARGCGSSAGQFADQSV